jgi:hypothetical protein
MQSIRLAPPQLTHGYPLPVARAACWVADADGFSTTLALDDLPDDHIVVASLAQLDGVAERVTFTLRDAQGSWTLCPNGVVRDAATDARVSTHIDYFHVRQALLRPSLTISIAGAAAPQRYLASVSWRAFRVDAAPGAALAQRLVVGAISQLTAPRAMRHRICSTACVTMVLRYHGRRASLADVSEACHHAPSTLFGVWPLAIDCAASRGLAASVECFVSLDQVAPIIARGLPVIASIRFEKGQLPGAPLTATDGHLVVVTGMDTEWVYVNDPAAPDAATVPRAYPRAAFARAWLAQRGVGYVMSPP